MRLVPLGQLRALGDTAPAPSSTRSPALEATAIGLIAVGSVAGLVLYATGQTKLAAMLGATGVIVGATFSVVRVLDQGRSGDVPVLGSLFG